MLEEVLDHIHNWFETEIVRGQFSVEGGSLVSFSPNLPRDGQYIRIVGSVFNDGLHLYPATDLTDEEFRGEIWLLAVPRAVQDLAEEIGEWVADNPPDNLLSESFGGYTYSKATDGSGRGIGWQGVFRGSLNRWRKLS